MPRLNRNIAINGVRLNDDSVNNSFSKNLTFFGMVGAAMTAMSLKERWDACTTI